MKTDFHMVVGLDIGRYDSFIAVPAARGKRKMTDKWPRNRSLWHAGLYFGPRSNSSLHSRAGAIEGAKERGIECKLYLTGIIESANLAK